uniref:Uncharacterized protein n=1 Tax=Meloidogyne floridensis TaxID=298350 RepID=A0A915NLW7_9BILA
MCQISENFLQQNCSENSLTIYLTTSNSIIFCIGAFINIKNDELKNLILIRLNLLNCGLRRGGRGGGRGGRGGGSSGGGRGGRGGGSGGGGGGYRGRGYRGSRGLLYCWLCLLAL